MVFDAYVGVRSPGGLACDCQLVLVLRRLASCPGLLGLIDEQRDAEERRDDHHTLHAALEQTGHAILGQHLAVAVQHAGVLLDSSTRAGDGLSQEEGEG